MKKHMRRLWPEVNVLKFHSWLFVLCRSTHVTPFSFALLFLCIFYKLPTVIGPDIMITSVLIHV